VYSSKSDIPFVKFGYAAVRDSTKDRYNIIDKTGKEIYLNANYIIKQNDELFFVIGKEIKNKLGFEIKKENVFANMKYKNQREDYFIHKKLILTRMNEIWSKKVRSYYQYDYNTDNFIYIDSDGFVDGLLYVRFYDNERLGLVWGYINEEGEIVYRSQKENYFDNGIKMNVNYQETSGLFYDTPEDNILKQKYKPGKLSFVLDSAVYERNNKYSWGPKKRLCYRFKIINETKDTLKLQGYYTYAISVQAKDRKGKWRKIQSHSVTDVIETEIHKLEPNQFWEYSIQSYSGGFKTKMRVVVNLPELYDWENHRKIDNSKTFVSNEIDCEINAAQFVREKGQETYPFE
jgi:hypothetical protein